MCNRKVTRTKVTYTEEWDEYCVKAWDQEGKRWPEADYYTDDKEDALATARSMKNPK